MSEYLRRDSVMPVLRLLIDLAFLGPHRRRVRIRLLVGEVTDGDPASIAIARLFVIGHDACHGSYTHTTG